MRYPDDKINCEGERGNLLVSNLRNRLDYVCIGNSNKS